MNEAPAEVPSRKRTAAALLLLAVTLIPYLFTLQHDFVYDDHGQIEENVFLKNPVNLAQVLFLETLDDPNIINGRRPFVLVTYFADRMLWKEHPAGYRLTNLLVHYGVMVLLFFLVRGWTRSEDRENAPTLYAFVTALLFGVHPLLVESVHMPSFRPDILTTFFILVYVMLGTSKVWTGGRIKKAAALLGSLTALLLAVCSKESGAAAPLVLALAWWLFPVRRPKMKVILLVLGLSGLVILGFVLLSLGGDRWQGATGDWNGLSLKPPDNYFTAPWIWVYYWIKLLVPYPQQIDYVIDPVSGWLAWRFGAGLLGLGLTAAAIAAFRSRRPCLSFGLGWMLILYLPVSNLLPLLNPFSERLAYGLVLGFAFLPAYPLSYFGLRNICCPALRKGILGVFCVAGLVMTAFRLQDFRDDTTLWRDNLEKEPKSARAHTYMGLHYRSLGELQKAQHHYDRAAELNPRDVSSLINSAIIHGQTNNLPASIAKLKEAIRRKPENANAHWNLANAYFFSGQTAQAYEQVDKVIELEPRNLPALKARLTLYLQQNRFQDALLYARRILEVDPDDEEIRQLEDRLIRRLKGQP